MTYASRVPARRRALSRAGIGHASGVLLRLLLSTTITAIAPALASGAAADPMAAQLRPAADSGQPEQHHQAKQSDEPEPSAPPAASASPSASSTAPGVCEALATAAAANDLPVGFFSRLIWQESRFKPDAVSRKGAQGIAQFMPATAKSRGLENPFNSLEAIAKSGELLRGLRREFGNLGLAAAAYNAGSGRVHDWLGGRRPLPRETRAYVRLVTGQTADEWAAGQTNPTEMPATDRAPCNLPVAASGVPNPEEFAPRPKPVKPWGVEVVGGPTREKALARFREWKPKYASIVADREPHVVIRGILGEMGAARVRVGEDTRAGAAKLCAALRAAGTYCDVLRN